MMNILIFFLQLQVLLSRSLAQKKNKKQKQKQKRTTIFEENLTFYSYPQNLSFSMFSIVLYFGQEVGLMFS